MKIAAKIRLSHFALALAVLVVGLIGYYSVHQVSLQYDRALKETMPVIDALQDMRFHAEHVAAVALEEQPGVAGRRRTAGPRAAASDGPANPDAVEGLKAAVEADRLAVAFAALDAEVHRHRLLVEAHFPDESHIVASLANAAATLRAAANRLAATPAGTAAGNDARTAVGNAVDAISEIVRDALEEEQHELVAYQATIGQRRSLLEWTVVAVTLGAVCFALLFAVYVARRLGGPIVELRDTARRFAGRDFSVRARPRGRDEVGELAGAFNDMAQALGDTMVSRDYVENILARLADGVLVLDDAGRIRRANAVALALLPAVEGGLVGRSAREVLLSAVGEGGYAAWPTPGQPVELALLQPSGSPRYVEVALAQLVENDVPAGMVVTLHDVSPLKLAENEMRDRLVELEQMNRQLRSAQSQLLQSGKMAAIGQLSAGVAHEINNPISFIDANLSALARDVDSLIQVVEAYEAIEPLLPADDPKLVAVRALKASADFDYLVGDLPKLIRESRDGAGRVRAIVRDLKGFSHIDEGEWQWVRLDQCLDSTLNIATHELKYKARVVKDYGSAPAVRGLPSQLSQVFMNLLVNAGQAIPERGTITVRIGSAGGEVWVAVEDDGAGIAPENLARIFDPFFTTKPVGQGTGLGLALAYGIVERHHGRIEVASEPGKGTVFRVTLPIDGQAHNS